MKSENNNLGSKVITLRSIIDYEPFKMLWLYEGTYFGHVMPKTSQHTTYDDNVFVGSNLVNVKMFRLNRKRLLHGQIFFFKGGRSWKSHTWIVGHNF
jgi:hypothetical protein